MDRNKKARNELRTRVGGFEKLTPAEEKSIEIAREEHTAEMDKYNIIKKYLFSLIAYARKKSELNDIHHTIQYVKGLPENIGKSEQEMFWTAPDQLISVQTMTERLHESHIGMRITEVELQILKRQVFEAYEATQEEIDAIYHKLMGVHSSEPKTPQTE